MIKIVVAWAFFFVCMAACGCFWLGLLAAVSKAHGQETRSATSQPAPPAFAAVVHDDGQAGRLNVQGDNTVAIYLAGDCNLDGRRDALDVEPFVLALTKPAAYQARYGRPAAIVADLNGDGSANGLDVAGFVRAITGGR